MLYILIALGLVVLALVVLLIVKIRRRRNAGPISIVMLRSSPRNFTEADIRAIFRRLHKRDPQIQKLSPDATTDGYLIIDEELPPLAIIDSRRQYADRDDLQACAHRHDHPVFRKATLEHTSWVSIDAMGINRSVSKAMRNQVYTLLAPIAAELLDDACMLLYLPAEERVAEPGPAAEQLLREAKIGELFSDDELHAPLIHVEKDDAKINAAIAEARERLPEFRAAWSRLGPKCEGLVKARFPIPGSDDDSAELMWLTVTSTTSGGFVGVIVNHPVDDSLPRKDSTVEVRSEDVVDWAYVDEAEQPHGMFVERILMARNR